jgi:hypothetical protein
VLSLEARGAAPRNELSADVLDGSIQTPTSVYAADFVPQRPKLGRSEPVLNAFEFYNSPPSLRRFLDLSWSA